MDQSLKNNLARARTEVKISVKKRVNITYWLILLAI